MARPRTPTAVLEMRGAFKHNPQRKREAPEADGDVQPIGDPPASFLKPSSSGNRLVELWKEFKAEAPPGVLTIADRKQLESLCRVTLECERFGAKPQWYALQKELLKALYMNPVQRAQRDVPVGEKKDALDSFIQRKKA